ncbi:MAG: single-stranded-DNA-specific exonuclease RecJ [Alphaproteobacteria bacterium]|nr:single-stranded-DNA-specific exonuclease RecJ [Alphaproteobacteria bacterium]
MPRTKLFNIKPSFNNADWNLIYSDEFTKRFSDYLHQRYQIPEFISPYLMFKGINLSDFENFFSPKLKNLLPEPFLFKDLEKGVKRLADEIINSRPVGILGDYDVDGATSAAMISSFLEQCGCKTFIHIPDRFLEGYGPNEEALKSLYKKGTELIITVDCGISSFEPLKAMSNIKLDLIVIDHHIPDITLPPAYAIINPKRSDTKEGFEDLCAAGVVFIFLIGLNRELRNKGFFLKKREPNLMQFLDLVALGTVCDVVPLKGLNRAFVKQGLSIMTQRGNPGLKALSDISKLNTKPNTQSLGFSLGPRINAGGRIGNSNLGVSLLKEKNEYKAFELATKLDDLNKKRRILTAELEKKVIGKIEKIIKTSKELPSAIIVSGDDFHEGVTGIVAGRMKELYNRPVCIISLNRSGIGKGSGRSIFGVPLGKIILEAFNQKLISSGGGHDMAAGFTIKKSEIGSFNDYINQKVNEILNFGIPRISYIATSVIPISACTYELANWLQTLGPWGSEMEEPKFIIPNGKISSFRRFGINNEHASFYINDGSSKKLKVKKFNLLNSSLNIVFNDYENKVFNFLGSLSIDTWNNSNSVELMLDDIIYSDVT